MTERLELQRSAGPLPSFRAALAEAAARIQDVLDTAEKEAARIVEEAEARARRIREDTGGAGPSEEGDLAEGLEQALDLMREVVERAELTARDADALKGVASRLNALLADPVVGREGYGPSASTSENGGHGEARPDAVGASAWEAQGMQASPDHASGRADSRASDGGDAQLLAVQMAVGGCSDDEIERRLRHQFGREEVDRALDVVRKHGPAGR